MDGSVDFYRDWVDYKYGFGEKEGEFWLGNRHMHFLFEYRNNVLRIDMETFGGETMHAEYDRFWTEMGHFKLRFSSYLASSTAGKLIQHD